MMLAWSSPVIPKLKTTDSENPLTFPVTSEEESWIGSLLALGAAVGPFPFGFLSQKIGRKFTLISTAFPYIIGYLMAAFATTVEVLFAARLIAGLAVGGVFAVLPGYLVEVSDVDVRGLIGTSMNNFICFGLLLSYVVGPYISITWFSIICAIVPLAFAISFFIFTHDSPFYLIEKNKREEAEKSLAYLRNSSISDVQKEYEMIRETIGKDKENAGKFFDVFKSKGTTKAFLISNALMLFQQLSGINIILFYAQDVFSAAETDLPDEVPPMIVGAVQLISSFVVPVLVEKWGRKMLLLCSAAGMTIATIPLGLYFFLKEQTDVDISGISWLPILALVVYLFTYNSGFGPLAWTVMAEILPSNLKASTSSVTACFCWLVSFLVTKFFHNISYGLNIGMGGSFWIFAAMDIIAFIFTFFYVPETKGKSFQEIQSILNS
nr:facilitated trehalose transporter Tret1-like [Onthophagus taurus]